MTVTQCSRRSSPKSTVYEPRERRLALSRLRLADDEATSIACRRIVRSAAKPVTRVDETKKDRSQGCQAQAAVLYLCKEEHPGVGSLHASMQPRQTLG